MEKKEYLWRKWVSLENYREEPFKEINLLEGMLPNSERTPDNLRLLFKPSKQGFATFKKVLHAIFCIKIRILALMSPVIKGQSITLSMLKPEGTISDIECISGKKKKKKGRISGEKTTEIQLFGCRWCARTKMIQRTYTCMCILHKLSKLSARMTLRGLILQNVRERLDTLAALFKFPS